MNEINLDTIKKTYERIEPYIHKTPILTCHTFDEIASKYNKRKLYFKCENFQKVGAFKVRGAMNAILNTNEKIVVTHSSGNHAQALAYGSKIFKKTSYIIMPKTSPIVKQNAVKGYGGNIILCEPTLEDREKECEKILLEKGGKLIHPYNDENIINGTGTISIEIINQLKDIQLDSVLCPIGGGGLISGISIGFKGFNKNIQIFGGEPKEADDAKRSFEQKKLLSHEKIPKTIADGLMTTLGSKTFPIILENVSQIFTATEDEIIRAMKLVYERMKIVIEPSSAVCVAIALWNEDFLKLENVHEIVIIISGGNVDLLKLPFY